MQYSIIAYLFIQLPVEFCPFHIRNASRRSARRCTTNRGQARFSAGHRCQRISGSSTETLGGIGHKDRVGDRRRRGGASVGAQVQQNDPVGLGNGFAWMFQNHYKNQYSHSTEKRLPTFAPPLQLLFGIDQTLAQFQHLVTLLLPATLPFFGRQLFVHLNHVLDRLGSGKIDSFSINNLKTEFENSTCLEPNINVDLVSASLYDAGEQQMIMVVLALPPKDS